VHEPALAPALLGVSVVVWFVLEVRRTLHTRAGATRSDRHSLAVLRATTGAGFVGGVLVAVAVPAAAIPVAVASWIGIVLVSCGIALRAWSEVTLGEYFTFSVQTSADQPVIAEGPYRVVRHPAYLGMVLALLGVAMLLANWLSLLVVAVLVLSGLVYRIHVEECAMDDELGERWRSYAAGRSRLVPFVW
jgi:protein-S-isoprenylcysteine O-methyltransferase Ste14